MNETVFRRCHYIIRENQRVLKMAKAIESGNLECMGEILYEAHEGLSKWYEVSCIESDFLIAFAKSNPAVLGARQTGGGFGGCTLNIVHKNEVEAFTTAASMAYRKEFGIDLTAFQARPSSGTRIISFSSS